MNKTTSFLSAAGTNLANGMNASAMAQAQQQHPAYAGQVTQQTIQPQNVYNSNQSHREFGTDRTILTNNFSHVSNIN